MAFRASFASWVGMLLSTAVLLAAASCGKDTPGTDNPAPTPAKPTAYSLTLPAGFPTPVIPADNPLTNEGVALGRRLFYEKALSSTGTMSCGSCHQQSKAFTDGLPLAVGVDGVPNPRGTMSLTNVLWSKQLTWDGAFTTLETQAQKPLENTIELHQPLATSVARLQATSLYPPLFLAAFGTQTITPELTLKALAQFERTLISGSSRYDTYMATRTGFTADEVKGLQLYTTHIAPGSVRGAECFHCHSQPLMSSNFEGTFFNNGLDLTFADPGRAGVTKLAVDQGKFIAPTLRNIALTAPYMHDGRFKTLEEVLDHYSDHVQMASPGLDNNLILGINDPPFGTHMDLTATEKKQVIAFLKTLTDSTFISDPRFADPH
ncbi:cytochrome-c peroxidase [Hymenobacter cheonanensis]|uniref:cytochrome-c peroxidase n=1 Tax=Hymenobacter sp. CA2-7 TaxID=3063993 RepID=UPI002712E23C|nr:cytochrome c peroxidase [Hymenobacter sp. CA2-7]MDO7885765.1 cytochrome c peroxidase [Hymenobacter sp. CA2-7]